MFVDETLVCDHSNVELFIMLYKVVLTNEAVSEALACEDSSFHN